MNIEEILGGSFGIAVILFFLVMAVLIFLMPFFIYGTNKRTKETSQKLDATNKILEKIHVSMKERESIGSD